MIENGKIRVSYKELCDILGELDVLLGPSHKTVTQLRTLKEKEEVDDFRSGLIWNLITGRKNTHPVKLGEIDKFIRHAFPDINYEPPYEMAEVEAYIKPILMAKFPDFEKYPDDVTLENLIGLTVKVPVLKTGIKRDWKK